MSFEHKYLKYKQKYLDLKKEVSLLKNQLNKPMFGGAALKQDVSAVDSSSLNVSELTDTPKISEQAKQLGGYLMSSESETTEQNKYLNSESEDSLDGLNSLTETPQKHDMVVSINSSETEESMAQQMLESSDEESAEEQTADDDSSDKEENMSDEDDDSSDKEETISDEDQEGGEGDLETSISELEEIFSQLGGKKSKGKKEVDEDDSDFDSSSMSSLSSLDSSSSEFDL